MIWKSVQFRGNKLYNCTRSQNHWAPWWSRTFPAFQPPPSTPCSHSMDWTRNLFALSREREVDTGSLARDLLNETQLTLLNLPFEPLSTVEPTHLIKGSQSSLALCLVFVDIWLRSSLSGCPVLFPLSVFNFISSNASFKL